MVYFMFIKYKKHKINLLFFLLYILREKRMFQQSILPQQQQPINQINQNKKLNIHENIRQKLHSSNFCNIYSKVMKFSALYICFFIS